jgi:protein O-GlcNAc transferase
MRTATSSHIRELLNAALRLHQGGRLIDARRLYAQILEVDPRQVDALHFLGVLAHQRGEHDEAVSLIGNAIAQDPRVPAFHNNLGNALKAQNRLDEADAAYERALRLNPQYFEAHYNRGLVRHTQGRLDEAVDNYGKALAHKPDHVEAHNNLGNALQAQGKLDEALNAYGRALHFRPNLIEAHINAGNVLRAQGHADAAITSYMRALSLDARHAEALRNLGIVLLERGRLEESAAALQRAVSIKPHDAAARCTLGNTFTQQGRSAAAIACFRHCLELNRGMGEAALGLATASIPVFAETVEDSEATVANFGRALDELTLWDRDHPGRLGKTIGSHQPFYLAYRSADVGSLLIRYGDLASAAAAQYWQPPAVIRRTRSERLRLLIVSGQVRQHPVWDVILRGMIAHLDRRRFEIHLYHTAALQDAETEWAKARVDRFVQGPKPLQFWLEEVAGAQPDILLYPEVGMDPTSCALAALRLASVQVASWGHPVTTGLPTIDYFLSGALLESPQAEAHYLERLVRLPGTGVCTEASALRADAWASPDSAPNAVRFAICQQPMKFDPADDAMLVRIAQETGKCEFWLPSPLNLPWMSTRLCHRLAVAFRAAGLDPDAHLRVMPWLPRGQFLGFLDAMDVFLDCPGFSGYTTAWQAVHRGVPVVTLEGRFLRQRLAAGLLRQIGLVEGIVDSRETYIATAVDFAQRSPRERKRRRESMRSAAPKADDNFEALEMLEDMLSEAAAQ